MGIEARLNNFFITAKKMFTFSQLEKIFAVQSEEEKKALQIALDNLVNKEIIVFQNGRYFTDKDKEELKQQIEEFFQKNKKFYSTEKLEKIFKINDYNRVKFYKYLYELELQGKIFCYQDKEYIHVAEDSFIKAGCLMKSNKGKYYVKINDKTYTIQDNKDAKELDIVFIQEEDIKKNHPKHSYAKIVRVVRPLTNIARKNNYFAKGQVIKDIKNDSYYVDVNFERIRIDKKLLKGAFPGDIVNVLVEYDINNKPYASVVDILERKTEQHVFVLKKGKWLPVGTESFPVYLENTKDFNENDQILASISKKMKNDSYELKFISKINKEQETNREKIKLLAKDKGLCFEFDDKVLQEAKKIALNITQEEIAKRLDLRELETFTIDSSTAKDLDDAISLEIKDDKYRLYVHIADVSFYIRPNTALYNNVIKRGTSIYFGDMVIPQLPEILSNGICSLNPNEDRLAKTLIMDFDKEGELLNFELHNSIIRSNLKMTYDKVDALLNNENVDQEYLPFYDTLINMYKLAKIFEDKRLKRGNVSFCSTEYEFELDKSGSPVAVKERICGPAHKIIENFMLVTNYTLADYAFWLEIPYIYRNHECPQLDKIELLNYKLKQISHKFRRIKNLDNPKILQRYFNNVCKNKATSEIKYFSNIFLQAMNRAYYDDVNKGHYGLALEKYATFTSPIRRGPDLINHLILGEVLENGVGTNLLETLQLQLKDISKDFSVRQQEAAEFEIEIDYFLLKEFADKFFEKRLLANVDFLMNDKMFLKTQNNLSGVVELGKNYIYDEKDNTIIDSSRSCCYHVGDLVEAQIVSFDSKKHNIIFDLCAPLEKEKQKKYKKYC